MSDTPFARETIRLETTAMACHFAVILNPGNPADLEHASVALDLVHALEAELSVYRDTSDISDLNRRGSHDAVPVNAPLFDLLQTCRDLHGATEGAFDACSGPLIALWRTCRAEHRVPTDAEVTKARRQSSMDAVAFDVAARTIRFERDGVEFNLGGIGKGYALDKVHDQLETDGVADFLIHGGHSSLMAHGSHAGRDGWPVGIRNPLFPRERLATIELRDAALSTSGSGIQSFRHGDRRFGHIVDPRTGWPVEGVLSVTVIAPTAAVADALSTAFFCLGVEKTQAYCHNEPSVSALMILPPPAGRELEIVNCGVPDDVLFVES